MARSPIRNWFRKQRMPRTSLRLSRLEDRTVPANISGTIYQDWAGNGILNNNDPGAAGQTAFLDANNNGVLDVTGGTFTALDTPVPIPDSAGGVPGLANSVASVSGVSGTVADVNVQVDITHTWDSDLILTLIGPNGTRVILANARGGSGDNFTGTIFGDQAAASITTGVAPFTGSFRPEEVLSVFNGLSGTDVNGSWTLEVTDNAGADIGTIDSFSVSIVGQSEQSAVADASGLFTFTGLAAGNYNVRSVLPSGQTATGPAVYNVVLGASDVTGRDFGRLNQDAIYGTAFGDTNNNGVLDGAETRTPGVTAYIDANGNNQLDFQNQTTASTDPPLDIPDFTTVPGLASMPINISGYNQTITDVNVTVNITHTFVGDLILTLVSPDGTRVVLSNRRGGSNDNFVGTVFDDQAADPIDITPSPAGFPGSFRPDEALSAFNGLSGASVNGAWALEVTDNAGIDIGTIDSVSIELTGGERSAVTDSLGNFQFANTAPGTYSVRAVAPAGLTQTLPAANGSYQVTLGAGGTSNNKDFGFGTGGGAAPTVTGTTVNGGATQRSRVSSIDVTFSTQVTFASTAANAFTLTRNSGGTVSFTATANVVGGVTVVTLNGFTGATSDFGSLADGRYTLTTLANQVSAGGTNMTSNATYGDANGLFRFYGDTTADRRLDIADFGPFSLAYLQSANYNATLDVNQDGRIDIADFGQFSVRYFTTLP